MSHLGLGSGDWYVRHPPFRASDQPMHVLGSVAATLFEAVLSAEAGLCRNDICTGAAFVEQSGNFSEFFRSVASCFKAQLETEEAPHVVLPEFDVSSVNGFCFFDFALFVEKSAENVAYRLHLTPRFVVSKVERKVDTTT